MALRLLTRAPRLAVLIVLLLFATTTLTLAATGSKSGAKARTVVSAAKPTLVVPDVRHQAYVFAKGALEESGFAWRVEGPVRGYAVNTVVSQSPAPGAVVLDRGFPTIVLRLARTGGYGQQGAPENASPYAGTLAVPARAVVVKPAAQPAAVKARTAAPAPRAKPAAKPGAKQSAKPVVKRAPAVRKPDFTVAGAPREPADELLLDVRAKRLAAWLENHRQPTSENVSHWLYQHSWLVAGARFGWSNGAEALRTLVEVDRRTQSLWQLGAQSERVARAALAEVEARAR